jgi:hypothetical protein
MLRSKIFPRKSKPFGALFKELLMTGTVLSGARTLAFLVVALCLSFGANACFPQENSEDVKVLQKERLELLSRAATDVIRLYLESAGSQFVHPSFQEVFQAERESFKADMEYCDRPDERLAALEQHGKAADRLIKIAERNFNNTRGTEATVFQMKAYALEVKIELVKEKKRQKE